MMIRVRLILARIMALAAVTLEAASHAAVLYYILVMTVVRAICKVRDSFKR